MSVIKITEPYDARTVEDSGTELKATRVFDVEFNNQGDPVARPILALKARTTLLSVPQIGDKHPAANYLYCVRRNVSVVSQFVYKVSCSYSSISVQTGQNEDPLRQKPEISWTFNTLDERVDRAIARIEPAPLPEPNINIAITNSAGQSFDPPITKMVSDLVLHYVRNERSFSMNDAFKYINKVNSSTFLGAPPGTVMCMVYTGDKVYDEKYGDYYHMTYEFNFRIEKVAGKRYGWIRRILDEGLYKETGTNEDGTQKLELIKDDDNVGVVVPLKMDGNGSRLKKVADDVFLAYQLYEKVSFAPLNIRV